MSPSQVEFKPLPLSQIQGVLDPQTALVEYYLFHDTLVIMVVSHKGIVCYHIDDQAKAVERLAWETFLAQEQALIVPPPKTPDLDEDRYQKIYQQRFDDLKQKLNQLWQLLITPIDEDIASFKNLVIIPHGILHRCAFNALYDGEKYLLERHTLLFAPSASIYALCRQRNRYRLETLLAFGGDLRGNLPYTRREPRRIARLWGTQAFPFSDTEASEANLEKHLKGAGDTYDILHVSCHCVFNDFDPLLSHLELYGDESADGRIYVEEMMDYHFSLSLVMLNACSSGQAVISPGDEIQGFSAALLTAGAASLILNLWEAADSSAHQIATQFYTFLKEGKKNKAKCLKEAQLWVKERYPHPFHWANHILLGDERTKATACPDAVK